MPRAGSTTLGDLIAVGLARVEIACDACRRRGSYGLVQLRAAPGDSRLTYSPIGNRGELPGTMQRPVNARCEAI
jgi:hypothetical protein